MGATLTRPKPKWSTVNRTDLLLAKAAEHWPHVELYDKQVETLDSVAHNKETVNIAANMTGKDFQAGLIALLFFRYAEMFFDPEIVMEVEDRRRRTGAPYKLAHTRRVVSTSVREKHLDVLWGEMSRFLQTSAVPLMVQDGGPLSVNAFDIRFAEERDAKKPINYLIGQVSEKGEGMSGHHAEYTLFIADEASGLDDKVYEHAQGWAKRFLIFGNPWPCNNFFRKMVREGDVE